MNRQDYIKHLDLDQTNLSYVAIGECARQFDVEITTLPYSIRILVENLLRKLDGAIVTADDLRAIATWQPSYETPVEIPYHPARVLMQDFTGVPAVVDLAAMRDAVAELGGDPEKVNPTVPVELVVDHSVQVDYSGTVGSLEHNVAKEYERNTERYGLLKWAQQSFTNFQVVPPNSGICHQVNLEHLGRVVIEDKDAQGAIAYPDTVVGLDSHTPMINGIGVMGWGVGGIEAEAVMLGQPYYMSIPQVIGVNLTGSLNQGVTATDLVLYITQILRARNVVEKFVEYHGPGLAALSIPDRATIANMTPEYGATLGFFPVDRATLDYLQLTGRKRQAALAEAYCTANHLFYDDGDNIQYTDTVTIDLAAVEPSLAGPARPQDRISLSQMKKSFGDLLDCVYERETDPAKLATFVEESGHPDEPHNDCEAVAKRDIEINLNGQTAKIGDGSVVIAAITSCTNTSNPSVLIGAGLIAKQAVHRGLRVPAYVKTSFAPGSRVVTSYLEQAGLLPYFEALGFHIAAFGCTTCIGNSGPLHPVIENSINDHHLNVAAVLSGNRNFEARIHQKVKANYLASPMLVVAFALAGRVNIDMTREPLGLDPNGQPVYLNELWPHEEDIAALVRAHVGPEAFAREYKTIFMGDSFWEGLPVTKSTTFPWQQDSTYIKKPPYFDTFDQNPEPPAAIAGARALLVLGDSVTTDHISPAGAIPAQYPAGEYLKKQGVEPEQFNSYGSRRGNHEVMMRGTFANIRIKNKLVAPKEGGYTQSFPSHEEQFVYDAAMQYQSETVPLIVLAGKEYGSGSSRDWAAKGSNLLGVKAVIAESFERIHRNNLVGMGILPLVFGNGESVDSLQLSGEESFSIEQPDEIRPGQTLTVTALAPDGSESQFSVVSRLDTEVDVRYYQHGGILPFVLRDMMGN
jgi:aconitate hydratase